MTIVLLAGTEWLRSVAVDRDDVDADRGIGLPERCSGRRKIGS
jgi:hypothetical protein